MSENLHYVVCWTEDDGIYACAHQHTTIGEALECECLIPDGRTFIRAGDGVALRSLDEVETEVFYREVRRLRKEPGNR
jgi:hypothetical protein